MKEKTVQEIIACLPGGKTPFYYFKDRYSLMMLSYYVGEGKYIHEIKKSRFGRLLNKPVLKNAVKNIGNGRLTKGLLDSVWPPIPECYLLTLGKWGTHIKWGRFYNQTSRTGTNLVLQLNFSDKHNRPYYKLIAPEKEHPFKCKEHPIAENGYHTLAWARIDMDLDNDEALIEEIQNDWIRMAVQGKATVERLEDDMYGRLRHVQWYIERLGCDPEALKKYVDDILRPHMVVWDEAMLAASIWFLKEEIGIKKIFYHTFDTGCKVKGISGRKPPKSLYTTLPKKFCFKETKESPSFLLQKNNRRIKALLKSEDSRFYFLDFQEKTG